MRSRGQTWLTAAILLAVLLTRLLCPTAAERLRQETARVLEADRGMGELIRAMGRAAASGDWRGEWIAALGNEMHETEA